MRFIAREHIDVEKWVQLLQLNHASVFSYPFYLDATAENWGVFVDENYSKGIALPYSIRLGQKIAYVPLFGRYLDVLGDFGEQEFSLLKNEIQVGSICFTSDFGNLDTFTVKNHQILNELRLNTLAKRKIKSFEKLNYNFEFSNQKDDLLSLIHEELAFKIHVFKHLNPLSELSRQLMIENKLGVLRCESHEHVLVGGLLFIELEERIIYLKGAFREVEKKQGGMYLAMYQLIQYSLKKGKLFDFGGLS